MENVFNESDIEIVEKYYLKSLSADEIKTLEEKLSANPAYKKEFDEYYAMIDALEFTLLKDELKDKLTEPVSIQQDKSESGKVISIFRQNRFLRLAAVFLLAAACYILFNTIGNNNQTQLAKSNLIIPASEELNIPIIAEMDDKSILASIKNEEYKIAVEQSDVYLKQIEIDKSELLGDSNAVIKNELKLKLYKAIALIKQGGSNNDLALQYLNEVEQSGEMPIANYAKWNKAMLYIQMKDINSAKEILNGFVNSNNSFKQKAIDILNEL